MDKNFKHLINMYHPIQWLFKSVERTRNRNMSDLNARENMYAKSEFLIIMADIALRVSQNNNLNRKIPTHQEFNDFINLYINTQMDKSRLLKEYGVIALSLMIYEQIKFIYPEKNIIARMLVLYSQYETEIKNFSGLTIKDFLTILLVLKGKYLNKDFFIFSSPDITHEKLGGLKSDTVQKFLNYFSITIKEYRLKLKEQGVDKRQLYSFRLLERYPIIKLDDNRYIVPNIDNLVYSMTSNLNIHLLEYFSGIGKGGKYHDKLGYKFESYIEKLTAEVFHHIVPAKEIVPKDTLNSEFVINYKSTSIAVEVKKFIFKRDTAFKNDISDLDELLKRHFVKAFAQIETTFNYIKNENKIGIIVIFGDLNFHAMLNAYLKENYLIYYKKANNGNIKEEVGLQYLENIIVMSVGAYESLMANCADDIIEILNVYLKKDINQRGDVIQTIAELDKKASNEFLSNTFDNTFKSLDLEEHRKENR